MFAIITSNLSAADLFYVGKGYIGREADDFKNVHVNIWKVSMNKKKSMIIH